MAAPPTTPPDVATLPVTTPAVSLRGARVSFGDRTLWDGLDLDVAPGEFVTVLGPNGSGKTTLVRVLLGLLPLTAGEGRIAGRPPRRGGPSIGYVPPQKAPDPPLPLRGGEQQRLRVAQALVGGPDVLLCDEPLLSLDLSHQRTVTRLIDGRRRAARTAVLFVTHEINPVLPLVDRVLYLVDGRFRIGRPEEVMTSEVLSELYRTQVDVVRVRGRLVVVGAEEHGEHCHEETA